MTELTETKVRSIIREELREHKIFDMPVQIAHLDGKIDKHVAHLDGKIDKHVAHLDGKIDKHVAHLDGKIDKLEAKLDAKVDGVISSNKTNFRLILLLVALILASLVRDFI